jgi:hypothetical protein
VCTGDRQSSPQPERGGPEPSSPTSDWNRRAVQIPLSGGGIRTHGRFKSRGSDANAGSSNQPLRAGIPRSSPDRADCRAPREPTDVGSTRGPASDVWVQRHPTQNVLSHALPLRRQLVHADAARATRYVPPTLEKQSRDRKAAERVRNGCGRGHQRLCHALLR